VRPADLDIEVADADGERAAAALGVTLERDESGGWSSRRGVALLRGIRIDVSAGLITGGDDPGFAAVHGRAIRVRFGRAMLAVLSPDDDGRRARVGAARQPPPVGRASSAAR
jgi:hypothetical protein